MSTEYPYARSATSDLSLSLRRQAIMSLIASNDRPISTSEVARLAGQTLGATAHHVRALARGGLLEWAGERRARGALQTFYVVSKAGEQALRRSRADLLMMLAGLLPAGFTGATNGAAFDDLAYEELDRALEQLEPSLSGIATRAAIRASASPGAAAA